MRCQPFLNFCLLTGAIFLLLGLNSNYSYAVECVNDTDCDDGYDCTTNVCDGGTCVDTDLCADEFFCNGVETCDPTNGEADINGCVAGTNPCPNDGPTCTTNSCSELNDECTLTLYDSRCDDSLYCTGTETCDPENPEADAATGCVSGTEVVCDDGFACTVDTCVEALQSCSYDADHSVCDDTLYCNGTEYCDTSNINADNDGCVAGTVVDCSDILYCTDDDCNEETNSCDNIDNDDNCDLGNDCLIYGSCNSSDFSTWANGGCYGAISKDDGTVCTISEGVNGRCLDGVCENIECTSDNECDDKVDCTTDSCNSSNTCVHEANNDYCNDGQYCNGIEYCDIGNSPSIVNISGCESGTPIDCSDGLNCTDDNCNEETDLCENTPNNSNCDNGTYCDGEEICDPENAGADVNGCIDPIAEIDCNDSINCTTDSCDENNDTCSNVPDDNFCDDSNPCTTDICSNSEDCTSSNVADGTACAYSASKSNSPGGICISGVCEKECTQNSDCNDGFSCTSDTCDPTYGYCVYTPVNSACDDSNVCNGAETCDPDDPGADQTTGCMAGNDIVCPPDADPCTDDTSCDPSTGCSYDVMADGTECEISPDILEVCISGNCVEGCISDAQCDDGLTCTTDICNLAISYCEYTLNDDVCSDPDPCNGEETCSPYDQNHNPATGCVDGAPLVCDDGLYCNGTESCVTFTGCVNGNLPDCDDGVDCTTDSCNENTDSCDNLADDNNCEDISPCQVGLCDSTEGCYTSQLANGIVCDSIPGVDEICHEGECLVYCETNADCNDELSCTLDSCDTENNVCVFETDNSVCSDGNACNGAELCDPDNQNADANGCVDAEPLNCNDGYACTTDSCNTELGCINTPNNAYCSDNAFCTGEETCNPSDENADNDGCVAGTLVNCDDGLSCSTNYCDEVNDTCAAILDNDVCNDNLFCNGNETCNPEDLNHDSNGCVTGSSPCTSDGIGCTVDDCDEENNLCTHEPDNNACDNDKFCDGTEICSTTLGCISGTPVNCNDEIDCTADSCDETIDSCVNSPNHSLCQNDIFCDGEEVCDTLLGCVDGSPETCDDGIDCTVDSCNPLFDICYNIATNSLCDNGLFCDGEEICVQGSGCQTTNVPDCNIGGNECTDNSCNETTDTCDHVANDGKCDNGLYCDGAEFCDLTLGCRSNDDIDCDDGIACTIDTCNDENDECIQQPDDALCDDGGPCKDLIGCNIDNGCQYTNHPDDEVCNIDPVIDETCQNGLCVADCEVNSDCNDNIGCTNDICSESGHCINEPMDEVCDNGVFCDGAEYCSAETGCETVPALDCSDGFDCTDDSCDEVNDVCVNTVNDANCDDGNWCTGDAVCLPSDENADSRGCVSDDPRCDDGYACTEDICNSDLETCENIPKDSNCDDGLYCSGTETCDPDSLDADEYGCIAGEEITCDDGFACTDDSCDEDNDTCVFNASKTYCDNNNFCDGLETCDPLNESSDIYGCLAGNDPCVDSYSCTNDSCNEETDTCFNIADNSNCSDNLFCNGDETCDPANDNADQYGCVAGSDPCVDEFACTIDNCVESSDTCTHNNDNSVCNDNQYCNGDETCDPTNNSADQYGCVAGSSPCVDEFACTDDSCNEQEDSCQNIPNNSNCNDNLFCNGDEVCDPDAQGSDSEGCIAGVDPCMDSVECTDDSCNESDDSCANEPNNAKCDNGVFCDGQETCDSEQGCIAGQTPQCDDNVNCTQDNCDQQADKCVNTPDDSSCNDNLFCNGTESCDTTLGCVNNDDAPDCNDSISCTDDSCSNDLAKCVNTPVSSRCDDGAFCNGVEICDIDNGCIAGEKPGCDDEIDCTVDDCNEDDDSCTHVADNTFCDDGQFCTGTEICSLETGCETLPRNCNDYVLCTLDSCDEDNNTCVNEPDDTVCEDHNPCTEPDECTATGCSYTKLADGTVCDIDPQKDESCQNGLCVPDCLSATDCDDGFDCTSEICNGNGHCEYSPDDDICNEGREYCDNIAQCLVGEGCIDFDPPDCDDAIDCTVDLCSDSLSDCVNEPDDSACNDFEPCTIDSCDTQEGCTYTSVDDYTACGANGDYICIDGVCQPAVEDGDADTDLDGDLDDDITDQDMEDEQDQTTDGDLVEEDKDDTVTDGDEEIIVDGDKDSVDTTPDGDEDNDEAVVDGDDFVDGDDSVDGDKDNAIDGDDTDDGNGGGCNSSNANSVFMMLLLIIIASFRKRRI